MDIIARQKVCDMLVCCGDNKPRSWS